MSDSLSEFACLTESQRRHLVHISAALRESIPGEIEYDHEPDFVPMDDQTTREVWHMIANQITQLMFAAHAKEAALFPVGNVATPLRCQVLAEAEQGEARAHDICTSLIRAVFDGRRRQSEGASSRPILRIIR